MALDNYSYDYGVFPPLDWSWDWELRALGDGAIHEAFPAMLGVESPGSSEASSGYLQDAVAHWSGGGGGGGGRWKRQRMATASPPQRPAAVNEELQLLLQGFWDSSGGEGDLLHDLNTMIPEASSSFVSGKEEEETKRGAGVLYPFAVVKPLGLDAGGTTTLKDVNQRILRRPARPVRHPVGPFACGPAVLAAHGLGLSGKTVVSLTKIRTGGKGTITIIRTRG